MHLAVILESADRLLGHRVHSVRADELLDVHDIAVLGVLRRRRSPERPLHIGALAREERPARARERPLVVLVRELRVRDRELAAQRERVLRPDRLEALVGLGVDTGDEEARNGVDGLRIAAVRDEALEPAQVRLDDFAVALEREDERHVDVLAVRDALLDRAEARLRSRDLDVEVRLGDPREESHRLVEGSLTVVGKRRVDLPGHETVPRILLVHGGEHVERRVDVARGELQEDLLRIALGLEQLLQLRVVVVALRDRLLEDRRIRRLADDSVVLHELLQRAGLEHVPRQRIDPDRLALRAQRVQVRLSHVPSLFPSQPLFPTVVRSARRRRTAPRETRARARP